MVVERGESKDYAAMVDDPDVRQPRPAPASWIEALEEGRADIAAGRTYDLEEVLREFEAEDALHEATLRDEVRAAQ